MVVLTTIASFKIPGSGGGSTPEAGLVADANENLFGTTFQGGTHGDGTVFEVAKSGSSYASAPTNLVSFSGADGATPIASLFVDGAGNLFGTTFQGGTGADGTVFEVAKTGTGYATTPTTLVNFNFTDGGDPASALIADSAGDLFGTTLIGGGTGSAGTVFEIAKSGTGYASAPTTLARFTTLAGGMDPQGGLIMDAAGDLFGTTMGGGASGGGTVYEIPRTGGGYAATPTTLVSLPSGAGSGSIASLVADAAGDLFGTTKFGGAHNQGSVFEIVKTGTGYASTATTLVSFDGSDGSAPFGNLIVDAAGNLFGTTFQLGTSHYGTVFEIAKSSGGYASTPTTLVDFNGANGQSPYGGLIADSHGDLFGTTSGRTGNLGAVFELTGTGYQVPCYLGGTRIATLAGERAVEALVTGDLVMTASGAARPVTWIGHRHLDCRAHPNPSDVWPVRVCAHAFGAGMPYRDLCLSPDHAVFLNNLVIPIRYLINGYTVVQERVDEVTYYHVELATHDVILAEGLPCESYLDTGNRSAFVNGAETLHGEDVLLTVASTHRARF